MGWLSHLTGGRPMRRQCFCFTESLSHRPVYLWLDSFGRRWLAAGPWSRFRVPATYGPEIWNSFLPPQSPASPEPEKGK